MATGKVRIFELAKELNMSSKDLMALFGRLGLEAKSQLSVVEPKVADLLRAQLKGAAKPAPKAAPAAKAAKAAAPAPRPLPSLLPRRLLLLRLLRSPPSPRRRLPPLRPSL